MHAAARVARFALDEFEKLARFAFRRFDLVDKCQVVVLKCFKKLVPIKRLKRFRARAARKINPQNAGVFNERRRAAFGFDELPNFVVVNRAVRF